MAAAVVEFDFVGGGGSIGTGVSAEGGFKFSRYDDLSTGTAPIPIPTSAGTNYSFYKPMALKVTTISSPVTTINNFTIRITSGSNPAGITMFFKAVAQGSYAQAAVGTQVAPNATTNDATPATYTLMTTAAQQWDPTGASSGTTGLKGMMVYLLLGVGYDYVGGGNSGLTLQGLTAAYDEA